MRIRKSLLTVFIIFIFLWNESGSVFAMNTGFATDEMDPIEQQSFLSNIHLSLITEEPKGKAIECFDVDDNGWIVVGSKDLSNKTVSIYAPDGTFQYGYEFVTSGSYGVEWDGNNILIYFVRGDVAALFDATGTNLEVKKIQNTIENNSYWNYLIFSSRRTSNENQYIMKNNLGIFNIFASSYSQLIKVDADGNITTIYDVSSTYNRELFLKMIFVISFIVLAISILVVQSIMLRKKSKFS